MGQGPRRSAEGTLADLRTTGKFFMHASAACACKENSGPRMLKEQRPAHVKKIVFMLYSKRGFTG